MADASGLITAATRGDAESLRQLLMQVQRSSRLTAAIFLPNLREVDTVVLRLGTVVASSLAEVPLSDPLPWLRGRLREMIAQRLDELERNPAYGNDPMQRLMLSSGRERLTTVPVDADATAAITARLRFMSKGATDLLTLRFTNGVSFAQIADQRRMSLDDVSLALQTACRQLDWTGDASGGMIEAANYRLIDGMVCSNDAVIEGLHLLRARVLDDMGLGLRVVRAARLHLIAAAWFAPDLVVEKPVLTPARPPAPAAPTRRSSKIQLPSPEIKPGGRSTPTKRQLVLRNEDKSAPSIDDYPVRSSRTGLITTLIGGALVLSGVALFLLHKGSTELPAPTPIKNPPTAQQSSEIIPSSSTPEKPVVNVEPAVAPPPVPSATVDPAAKPLFSTTASPAPLAVWSTRRLVEGYSGPLLRVRRSGDNAERDFGFSANGALDSATLTTFTSRSSGHVAVWYDQSGNQHHLRQENRDQQPRIISDGTLQTDNSRPVISFDRSRFEHFSTPAAIPLGCLYAVVKVRLSGDGAQGLFGSLSDTAGETDAYYPIVDRNQKGHCEWWLGGAKGQSAVRAPIARDRLLVWHCSSNGTQKPTLVLRIDGKDVGSVVCSRDAHPPTGPTVVGCTYWSNRLADPFGGTLGEMFVLTQGSSPQFRDSITQDLKTWWKIQ